VPNHNFNVKNSITAIIYQVYIALKQKIIMGFLKQNITQFLKYAHFINIFPLISLEAINFIRKIVSKTLPM